MCLALVALAATLPATADYVYTGGEINISGATLFVDFFYAPAGTNDFVDVDGDGTFGFDPMRPMPVDQLAPVWSCPNWTGYWQLQYRGVGSGNGLTEFVDWQLLGLVPDGLPADNGVINRFEFANADGLVEHGCQFDASCWAIDLDEDGTFDPPNGDCNGSNTPRCPCSIDIAVMDVPTRWFVIPPTGAKCPPAWNKIPGEPCYGDNPTKSWDTNKSNKLKTLTRDVDGDGTIEPGESLNTNTASPDEKTVFDEGIAQVPVAFIANAGTGLQCGCISVTELQYLFITGRLPNGGNLVAATRDSGSGTRNASMNSLGVDPSYGRGDNLGNKNDDNPPANLGPGHQPTNCGGSSVMERVVQNRRLALGYTGLAGPSRAAPDAEAGRYEIVDVMFDDRGGTERVRPTISSVIFNCDPDTGYQIAGPETFASRGDPYETNSGAPEYMDNQAAAGYLKNIHDSIVAFVDNPGQPEDTFMPGQYLAQAFFLPAGMDCSQDLTDPTNFIDITENATLRQYMLNNSTLGTSTGDTPDCGFTPANLVPIRNAFPDFDGDGTIDSYSDGSVDGQYADLNGNLNIPGGGFFLSERNQVAGDFDYDKDFDVDDIDEMVEAYQDPRQFVFDDYNSYGGGGPPGDPGDLATNHVIPEIIGDFNGDGNFDVEDVRYFADGLALEGSARFIGGQLNRRTGFTRVDQAWKALTGCNNFFGTAIATDCKPYQSGDSRADIAGNTRWPGAQPHGSDGVINAADIDAVHANYVPYNPAGVSWAHVLANQWALVDLSADMDGNLVIDDADLQVVLNILCTIQGDADLSGTVDQNDLDTVDANLGGNGGWAMGDFDGDGQITTADRNFVVANFGYQSVCKADVNCDSAFNNADIPAFVLALTNPPLYGTTYPGCDILTADINCDGAVNNADIPALVELLTSNCN